MAAKVTQPAVADTSGDLEVDTAALRADLGNVHETGIVRTAHSENLPASRRIGGVRTGWTEKRKPPRRTCSDVAIFANSVPKKQGDSALLLGFLVDSRDRRNRSDWREILVWKGLDRETPEIQFPADLDGVGENSRVFHNPAFRTAKH